MNAPNLVLLSLDLEYETGYDSIPTIENMYDGQCPWPTCNYRSRDAEKMWKHAHFGRKHKLSFGASLAQVLAQRAGTIGMHA